MSIFGPIDMDTVDDMVGNGRAASWLEIFSRIVIFSLIYCSYMFLTNLFSFDPM